MPTIKEDLILGIQKAQIENPGFEVVVLMHPVDYMSIEGMKELGVRTVSTREVKMGKILITCVPPKPITIVRPSLWKRFKNLF